MLRKFKLLCLNGGLAARLLSRKIQAPSDIYFLVRLNGQSVFLYRSPHFR